ncbi:rod shape-determining protein MreC [Lachnoclostridium sp. Marseille-P6806]|uniref:rod shape-determining protein MreC n=1 Tax=Lachnoclostridium sp. Marseille-P6806 TaxID=2364793 RepID=UPI0010323F01|nr:rod shape-determining protein MreC [Lachnoclostridium sp. Marseille-P6806]
MSPVVKRPKEKFHLPAKYALLLVSAVCVLLIVLTYSMPLASEPFHRTAGLFVVPFQNGISAVGGWMVGESRKLAGIRSLQEQNEQLLAEIDELKTANTTLQQERYELTRLRELYDLDARYQEYKKTGARIIAKDSGSWYHSFLINKGTDDGLAVDMNVIAGNGLVGRITSCGADWSRVLTIIDDNSNVSAQVLATEDTMIVSGTLAGYADGSIRYSRLTDRADQVGKGDKVVTSNISNKYLPGILIGYIRTIEPDPNNLTKSGSITPAVDFEHLDTVLVILERKKIPDTGAEETGIKEADSE